MSALGKVANDISRLTGIPLELLPLDIIAVAEKTEPNLGSSSTPIKAFSDSDWENELGALISYLVAERKDDTSTVGTSALVADQDSRLLLADQHAGGLAKQLLAKGEKYGEAAAHKAMLGVLILVNTNPNIARELVDDDSATAILERYPLDLFLQAAGRKVLLVEEKLQNLTRKDDGRDLFDFPPFQKGLPYLPHFGNQVTLVFHEELDRNSMQTIITMVERLTAKCKKIDLKHSPSQDEKRKPCCGFNIGFDLDFWCEWCKLAGREPSLPVVEAAKMMNGSNNFMKKHKKLRYTPGDVWMYLKAETKKYCRKLLKVVRNVIKENNLKVKVLVTSAYRKSEGRLFGGQFLDGIVNAIDAVSMIREVLIPPMPTNGNQINPDGGTFAFVQFFHFDRPPLNDSSQPISENMIGRDSVYSETLARLDERAHVKRARIINPEDGTNTELIRQPLPYVVSNEEGDSGPNTNGMFFVAFGKSAKRFDDILNNILGDPSGFTTDLLMHNVQGKFGRFFYCPNGNELAALPVFTKSDIYPDIPFWSDYVSENPALFYNHIHYLRVMSTNEYVHKDPPTERILYLLSGVFSRWHSTWTHKFDVPRLPHLREFLADDEKDTIMNLSIQERKGFSYKMMLRVFTTDRPLPTKSGKIYGYSENFDTYRINPKELIVGVTDRLSFGSGKEVMPYLKEGSETTLSVNLALTEAGNMGHIVPGHNYMLEMGVTGLLNQLHTKLQQKDLNEDQRKFYQSAYYAYEGVQLYLLNYAGLATSSAKKLLNGTVEIKDRENMRSIAKRMLRLAVGDPKDFTFHDALQMVFSMHCCLHLIGQAISVGRLDQLLIKYYKRDIKNGTLSGRDEAQELIDAFFIKFDEHAVLNRYNIPYGHTTLGSTCVTGRGGPFATGDSMNQWIQQITVGGCDDNGDDAFNEITEMCLKAARRLPLNAPCLSLRLTPTTPTHIQELAAKAILSGGAHPILYHDKKMISGLYGSLKESFDRSGIPLPDDLMKIARSYSADGCFEPMFPGRTEFKFGYVFILQAVIYAINSGANYQPAGPLNLAGGVSSYRTPLAEDIVNFEMFKEYFRQHLKLMVVNLYSLILNAYGNPWEICPSPMMSCLLEGCLESGKDMTNGGSRFHILTPMYVGFTNTVNSLYNIKKIVYDENDVASLSVLKMALMNNWGENMVEPFYDSTKSSGILHSEMWAQRYKDLREYALRLPKFGTDTADDEINKLAEWVASEMEKIAYEALYDEGPVLEKYKELQKKHNVPGKPFLFQVMTGTGTFENYVSVGAACAATPDGRLNGQPVASDVSQQPYPQDRPVPYAKPLDIIDTLKPYNQEKLDKYIPNGCEIDITVPETFPEKALLEFIDSFIKEETGSNLVTVTCIDAATMERARLQPQKFDLVRNRMGGWSNFFVAMFDEHQKQHARRPVFGPHSKPRGQ